MRAITDYYYYRKLGVKNAWELAGMDDVLDVIKHYATIILICICVILLLSEQANAINEAADNKAAARIKKKDEYIAALESILSKCVSDSSAGNPIKIGDEWFLCGIQPLGKFSR